MRIYKHLVNLLLVVLLALSASTTVSAKVASGPQNLGSTGHQAQSVFNWLTCQGKTDRSTTVAPGCSVVPKWEGSGPTPGVLGANASSSSTKAIQNYYPKNGSVEFVFDPKSNTFVVGTPKTGLSGSPHEQLARSIGADESSVVGGMFSRGANGEIITNESSGHFWRNWTPEVREQFQNAMKNYNINVQHSQGM